MIKIERVAEMLAGVALLKEEMLLNEDILICEVLLKYFNDTLVEISKIKNLEEMRRYKNE